MQQKLTYTIEETAEILGVARETLARMRMKGDGPKFIKVTSSSRGTVIYRHQDILDFLEERVQQNTVKKISGAVPFGRKPKAPSDLTAPIPIPKRNGK